MSILEALSHGRIANIVRLVKGSCTEPKTDGLFIWLAAAEQVLRRSHPASGAYSAQNINAINAMSLIIADLLILTTLQLLNGILGRHKNHEYTRYAQAAQEYARTFVYKYIGIFAF